jgi:cysteine desulfurase
MADPTGGARKRIYMDYAAACPVDERVLNAMTPFFRDKFGNPSSLHTDGREPRKALEAARMNVATLVNAKRKEEVIFTSGGTEASNIGIKGVAARMKSEGNHIVTSSIEHISVLNIMKFLEKSGFEITYVPPTKDGFVDLQKLQEAIRKDTVLATIMYANNEIGTIQPIDEIGKILEEKDVFFHVDAVAAAGKVPIDVQKSKIDLLSCPPTTCTARKGQAHSMSGTALA